MGCDIHTHVEIRVNDRWEHWSLFNTPRHYQLFERMAGVRGLAHNAIVAPRGLPDDSTTPTKLHYDYWGEYAHSVSWLGRSELVELDKWISENINPYSLHKYFGYLFGNDITDLPSGVDDVRVVFWFDS